MNTYKEALDYIFGLINYEKTPQKIKSLDRFSSVLDLFGNPQHKLKRVLLIAGTKGKGSTTYMLSKALINAGYNVGTYLSPHVLDIRERIQFNGEYISTEDFTRLLGFIKNTLEKTNKKLTFFETLTLMAFLYFEEKNPDFAVIEVGLGGRLDATNIVFQSLTIITKIHYDHTQILGRKLEEIAYEKVHVVKHPNPIITLSTQEPEVLEVIGNHVKSVGAPFFISEPEKTKIVSFSTNQIEVEIRKNKYNIPIGGLFQRENITLSVDALELLGVGKINFDGLFIPGRFHIVDFNGYTLIFDIAHNPVSLYAFLTSLKAVFPNKKVRIIFALSKDKDKKEMVKTLERFTENVTFTTFTNPRATPPDELLRFYKVKNRAKSIKDPIEAFRINLEEMKNNEILAVTGSTFLVSDILKEVLKNGEKSLS